MPSRTVIILAGATASGKTAAAIRLAKELGTEIISADSRQCYRELNIGVARPSEEELAAVPHHFIASHSIHDQVTASDFEAYALEKAEEIFKKNDTLVMVGGTGLYIRAFYQGLDNIPRIDTAIREKIVAEYDRFGLGWLQEQVQKKDPLYYETGEIRNPQRLMRALEVLEATGKSIRTFQKGSTAKRDFNVIRVAIEFSREELDERIFQRVDKMIADGLEEEARALLPYRHLNALQTVGYEEMFDYFDGLYSRDVAIEKIKVHTRQYARRQFTWFKKDKEIRWLKTNQISLRGLELLS
ncbi:tRNA (adenosine(37)-N6)-dimethylallyltransferase MiaA [Nostoc ellipsosporum NOK]|nr:tRNA (adenosine(37)-N6)-dimethylallyltransferase MiaA [Nostoc ellipsosporum NOK]